jgi:transposase
MAHTTAPQITVGVDTHLDVHVAHAADQLGRRVATVQVPTTPSGYQHLLAWARGLGQPIAWGVEGTGSYGAATANPTRWTPRPPPRPCRPETSRWCPRQAMARWR